VRLEIEPGILAEFDRWLEGHVAGMLALPGFERADLETESEMDRTPAQAGNAVRTVRYVVRDRAALDDYLETRAQAMRRAAVDRFGDRFTATRRVLESTPLGDHEHPLLPHCRNCDARMRGQYCARCGQRARLRMITLWELLRDVVGEIFEHDSRVWRSLIPLLFRPGYLTSEYLAGRQMRYMPPVRMYLFLSIVFFVVAALGPDNGAVLQSEGGFTFSDTPPADDGEEAIDTDEGFQCNIPPDFGTGVGWLDRIFTPERLEQTCQKIAADHAASFLKALVDNLPAMMFLFLPVLALVLKVLYLGSRRYYTEHLLFALHYHAFFFLIASLSMLMWMLVRAVDRGETAAGITTAVVSLYLPWYLYRAMRRVYDQHVLIRLFKYFVLVIAYLTSLALTFAVTVIVTALSL